MYEQSSDKSLRLQLLVHENTVHCSAKQHNTAHCSAKQNNTVHCSAKQNNTVHCSTKQNNTGHCSAKQNNTGHCSTVKFIMTVTLCLWIKEINTKRKKVEKSKFSNRPDLKPNSSLSPITLLLLLLLLLLIPEFVPVPRVLGIDFDLIIFMDRPVCFAQDRDGGRDSDGDGEWASDCDRDWDWYWGWDRYRICLQLPMLSVN